MPMTETVSGDAREPTPLPSRRLFLKLLRVLLAHVKRQNGTLLGSLLSARISGRDLLLIRMRKERESFSRAPSAGSFSRAGSAGPPYFLFRPSPIPASSSDFPDCRFSRSHACLAYSIHALSIISCTLSQSFPVRVYEKVPQ